MIISTLTWLGDDSGEDRLMVKGIPFTKGEPLEVGDEELVKWASTEPSFMVNGKTYIPEGAQPHPNSPEQRALRNIPIQEMFFEELRNEAKKRNIDIQGLDRSEVREKLGG